MTPPDILIHKDGPHEPWCACRQCEEALGEHHPAFPCAKRDCPKWNRAWETFTTRDGRTWCLGHIPLRSRLRLWWQERL